MRTFPTSNAITRPVIMGLVYRYRPLRTGGRAPPSLQSCNHSCKEIPMNSRLVRRFLIAAGLLCFTLVVGTIGFKLIDHCSWFDGFYMTLTTITTVGYQEVHPLSHAGRVFNSCLILFGVSGILLMSGAMTQSIVELELHDKYGKRRNCLLY